MIQGITHTVKDTYLKPRFIPYIRVTKNIKRVIYGENRSLGGIDTVQVRNSFGATCIVLLHVAELNAIGGGIV